MVKHLTSEKEKIIALGKSYSVEPNEVEVKDKTLHINFNNDVKKNADYFVGRANLIASAFTYFKDLEKVEVKEEYLRPKEADKKQEEMEE